MDGKIPIGDTINYAWNLVKSNIGPIILVYIVVGVATFALLLLVGITGEAEMEFFVFLFVLVFWAGQVVIQMGLIRVALNIYRGEDISIADLFSDFDKIVNFLIATLLFFIMTFIGSLFFILPGIYLTLRFGLFGIAIIKENLGPLEALKRSSEITEGNLINLYILLIVLNFVNVLGAIPFGLGLFITMPIMMLSIIHAYHILSGEDPNDYHAFIPTQSPTGMTGPPSSLPPSTYSGQSTPYSSTAPPLIDNRYGAPQNQPNIYSGPSRDLSYLDNANVPAGKKERFGSGKGQYSYSPDTFNKDLDPEQEEVVDLSDALIEEVLSPKEYADRALKNYKAQNYEAAISDYTKAISMDSGNKQYWYSRANCKIKNDDFMGAVDDFTEAIIIDPNFAKAYLNRGAVKKKIGAINGAKEDIKKAISLDPELTKFFKK